jgi:signal transduction histidine kinase
MQTIRALITLSILVPALAFAAAAWLSRRQVIDEAHQRVQTTVGLLREHALKVFDTHVLALKQIDDRTKDLDWETIGRSESLHQYLAGLSRDLGTPNGLWLTDARGRIRAASISFPAPEIDVSDREYFVAQRDRDAGAFVSVPYERRAGDKNWAFAISRRRSTPDGNFDGIVHVAIDTKYFTSFWEEVSQHSGHLIPLMREDGEMLVRYPAMIGQRLRLAPDAPFRQAIARTPNGIYTAVSRVDGIERINGYQKIGAYPLYISYSLETQAVLAPWYRNLLLYGGVALIASAALATLGWQALRRAGQEQRMFERWQSEQVRREEVETALHHAQKMEALGHLTGGIAHDFNNLLTVVLGNLEAIGRRTEAGDEPLRRSIRNAQKGAERAAALTQQLLAFARQQPLQPIDLDVNDLVQRILELLGRTLGEHISLRADLAPDLWPVRVDPNQLESASQSCRERQGRHAGGRRSNHPNP